MNREFILNYTLEVQFPLLSIFVNSPVNLIRKGSSIHHSKTAIYI